MRGGGGGRDGRAEVRSNKNRTNKQKQSNARDFHVLSQLFLESYFLNCQRGVARFRTLSAAAHSPKEKRWRPPYRRRDPPSVPGRVLLCTVVAAAAEAGAARCSALLRAGGPGRLQAPRPRAGQGRAGGDGQQSWAVLQHPPLPR